MPNIRHELIIAAPAEKIYNALTNQEGLSAWWTPNTNAQPEPGSIARFPFGSGYFKEMKIIALEPSRRVDWLCITGADEWVGTAISFQLYAGDKNALLDAHPEAQGQVEQNMNKGEATLLVFHHDNWKAYTPMFAECNYTWARFLNSLKQYCETGKGRPWPNQHRAGQ